MMKSNKYIYIGVLMIASVLFLNQFIELPHFIYGVCIGIGITFELIGAYAVNHDISKLKNFKRNLLRKFSGQK